MKKVTFYIVVVSAIAASCSSESNTWVSKAYHNTTAHFNGYFYAKEELKKIENEIAKSQDDDYNRVLRIFPTFDSTLSKNYEKELQEAIKMASIAIQRHPNSKWVDDAYIQVGKARLYSMDFGNAIQTFKYTNKIGKNKDTKHLAIINLIRTYIEHKEFNNALAAIDYLLKQDLSRTNRKKLYLERAYYYQLLGDLDNMVRNLTAAAPLLSKSDHSGRIYFIVGQVYQKLGFESEAYNYYKKCLSTNPDYEVDFYARLYMAQVTVIERNKDAAVARKQFNKLLKDKKNKEFKDKIYYEMGVFELKRHNLSVAVEDFNRSVRAGTNKKIDGEAYLRLGEIYYDTLKNYELSQAYYDSAIMSLPKDYEGYEQIKTRQEVLNEFVKQLKTIQWQDSLLALSTLDSVQLRARVDSVVTKRLKAEAEVAAKNKKKNRIDIGVNDNNNLFASADENTGNDENAAWYFSNPSVMAMGQTEFVRVWGNITLADNWRRSSREQSRSSAQQANVADLTNSAESESKDDAKAADPVDLEFTKLSKEIPRTEEAKKESLSKIEEAYFKVGEIYYFKLHENKNAVEMYEKMLQRFPETEHEPEVLYTLYLLLKDSDSLAAVNYAARLQSKHPHSTFAKILENPDYLQESSLAAEKQKVIYKNAYTVFESGHYDSAQQILNQAYELGETTFTPTLKLFSILLVGKTEDISRYQYRLDEFIKTYPDTDLATYAQKLLETSRKFQAAEEKRKGIRFYPSFDEPHYFVILYRQKNKSKDETFSASLEKFNKENFPSLALNTSNLIFNDEYSVAFVAELADLPTAMNYYRTFKEKVSGITELRNLKFDNFVITKDNFDIFYRTKGLNEYLKFFEKNYTVQNQ